MVEHLQFLAILMVFLDTSYGLTEKPFTHCYSYRLNLIICDTCSVPLVKNVLTQVKELSYFLTTLK